MTPLEAAEQEIRRLQIAKEKLVSGTKYNRIELEKKYFFITENYPNFVDKVTNILYVLGSIKMDRRHLRDLDRAKNRAYKLINL